MPNNPPSWDDVFEATPLNIGKLIEAATAAVAGMPFVTSADKAAIQARVAEAVTEALSPANVAAAFARVPVAIATFVANGFSGPVEKSPTDLL